MRNIGWVLGCVACVAVAPACAASSSPAVHRIIIGKLAFGPAPSDIHAGDTIEWVNEDIFLHSATAADKSFDLDIPAGANATVTVMKSGTIRYICKYHPGMQGQLIVGAPR